MAGQREVRGFWGTPAQQGETDALRRMHNDMLVLGPKVPEFSTLPLADSSWDGRLIRTWNSTDGTLIWMCVRHANGTYDWANMGGLA